MCWLDDQFLVSGSRDGTLALWRITDDIVEQVTSSDVPSFVYSKPLIKKQCKTADRVRAMCFNGRRSELAVISTNGYIHCWDGLRFKQVMSKVTIKMHLNINLYNIKKIFLFSLFIIILCDFFHLTD